MHISCDCRLLLSVGLFALLSCSGESDTSGESDADADTDTDPGSWDGELYALEGSITWNVEFEDGKGTDCSYTRNYTALEDWGAPWTCPDCFVRFRADITLDGQDCYDSITDGDPSATEFLGFSDDGTLYRTYYEHYPLSEQGTASFSGDDITTYNEVDNTEEGGFTFVIDGALTRSEGSGDPMHGIESPDTYSCGWPKADPKPYEGEWGLGINKPVPDGWFKDTCEEYVRLHDFQGSYMVIDVSAADCGPCQQMADAEHDFTTSADKAGIDVVTVTLMAPSLSAILDETSTSTLESWRDTYGLEGAVLGDRGWGYSMFTGYFGEEGMSYPSWLVVAPDLRVVGIGQGYGTGTWDEILGYIEGDRE